MRLSSLKKQTGMTLTESLLVLAVGALIAVLAYGAYRMASSDVKVQSQVNGTVQLVGKIKQIYASAGNYGTAKSEITSSIAAAKIVPSDFKTDGTTISNSWGGTVKVYAGATNTQFLVEITNVPSEGGCLEFLSGISSAANTLNMGGLVGGGGLATGSPIKTVSGYDASAASTACSANNGTSPKESVILVSQ